MASETATIKASSGSNAYLDVQKSLTGSASSGSTVTYNRKLEHLNVSCLSGAACKQRS